MNPHIVFQSLCAVIALTLFETVTAMKVSTASPLLRPSIEFPRGDAPRELSMAVEYFHAGFGHYFITAFVDEAAQLDANPASGWVRTGNSFLVEPSLRTGTRPVCRFFGDAFSPKSSHFYTPYSDECAQVKRDPAWQYEAVAFYLRLPDDDGQCVAGTQPLYRIYNNGASGAPNHRYTADPAVMTAAEAAGGTAEGHGITKIFACTPLPSRAPSPPGRLMSFEVPSTRVGYTYPITVYVPASYDNSTARYPTIYLTDGDITASQGAKVARATEVLNKLGAEALLVAIGGASRRETDYLPVGAAAYHAFLTLELVPEVERRFRVDKTERILEGHSYGGLFAVTALLLEVPGDLSFTRYIASEATLDYDSSTYALAEQMHARVAAGSPAVSLVLGHGLDGGTEVASVSAFNAYLTQRGYAWLHVRDAGFHGTHGEVWTPIFDAALRELLP